MKEYDAYLFDADGTIIDTRELIFRSFMHMGGEMRVEMPPRDFIEGTIGLPLRRQMGMMLGEGRDESYYERAMEVYRVFMMDNHREFLDTFPGVQEGLRFLEDKGKMLAVVSSRGRDSLLRFMEILGLLEFFPVCLGSEDTVRHKPGPEPALLALERLGAAAERSVFIGDAEYDMSCGKAAGMDVAYVAWGGMKYDDWPVKPDFAADVFNDLLF